MKEIEEVSSGIDAHIWKYMPSVLGAVRQGIRRIKAVESPEPSDSSSSSGYDSASTSPTDSPPMVITPDPGVFRSESPSTVELRATPSPPLVPNAERRAESPQESTSEDRIPSLIDHLPFEEEEEDNLFEVLANYAERKNRNFELLSRYLPGLLRRRDRTGEAVDSGEGQGEGTSSKEDPPPAEKSTDSSSEGSQSSSTSSQPDKPSSSGDAPRSTSRRARDPPPGLPPHPTRSASSQSRLTVQRHPSTSSSGHGQARSSSADPRSRSPREPIIPPSNRPERLSTAPSSRSSRQGRSLPRPNTPMTIPHRTAEEEEIDYRSPGPLCVGTSSAPTLRVDPEEDIGPFEYRLSDVERRGSESAYETANENSARSSDCDTARTMIPKEEFEQTKAGKALEDFLANYNKPPDDDDESSSKKTSEAQPSDQPSDQDPKTD